MSARRMAFLGSGEFEPWAEPVERALLERSRNPTGPVLVSPAAAAHEGDESFDGWAAKGLEHYETMGIRAEVLPLKTREDAHRDEIVRRVDEASMIFFSGGNPARLTQIVADTPFWRAVEDAVGDGVPYAGCSAGVACLTEVTFDSDAEDLASVWAPGIGFVRDALFGPHWDIVDTWIPGASAVIVGSLRPGQTFIGLDEETAMIGDGTIWRVIGRSRIHTMRDGDWARFGDGETFQLRLELAGRSATGVDRAER